MKCTKTCFLTKSLNEIYYKNIIYTIGGLIHFLTMYIHLDTLGTLRIHKIPYIEFLNKSMFLSKFWKNVMYPTYKTVVIVICHLLTESLVPSITIVF